RRGSMLERNLDIVAQLTGETTQELEYLADVMAVDLTDSVKTLGKDLQKLGFIISSDLLIEDFNNKAEEGILAGLFGDKSHLGRQRNLTEAQSVRAQLQGQLDTAWAAGAAGDIGAMDSSIEDIINSFISI